MKNKKNRNPFDTLISVYNKLYFIIEILQTISLFSLFYCLFITDHYNAKMVGSITNSDVYLISCVHSRFVCVLITMESTASYMQFVAL